MQSETIIAHACAAVVGSLGLFTGIRAAIQNKPLAAACASVLIGACIIVWESAK